LIEAANAVCADIRLSPEGDAVIWNLPASKTDTKALGAERTHTCACGELAGGPAVMSRDLCPACNLWDQKRWAETFRHWGSPENCSPLFPCGSGGWISKKAMVETFEYAARRLGLPLTSANGAKAWGGHAARRGGAAY